MAQLDVCELRSYTVAKLEVFELGRKVFILTNKFNSLDISCFQACYFC